jgi:hypothetical protein
MKELQEFLLLIAWQELQEFLLLIAWQELREFLLLMARVMGVFAHHDGSFFCERLFRL